MIPSSATRLPAHVRASELNVLLTQLPNPAERPLPPEEEDDDAFEPVDEDLAMDIQEHLEPTLGRIGPRLHDTLGPPSIDMGLTEPTDERDWGAFFTMGASARPHETKKAERPPTEFELFVRLPRECFQYWQEVVLEPFDDRRDAIEEVLGELARLPFDHDVRYIPPQIVASPDQRPLMAELPFSGVLLRDASTGTVRVPPMPLSAGGQVTFLSVTFLHPSEVRALIGPERDAALARLAAAGVDELFDPARKPVV